MVDQPHRDNEGEGGNSAPPKKPKRAVVVVHGIGSQSPMETLRRFVEAVWTAAPWLARDKKTLTWSKRDFVADTFETRRITTNHDRTGKRTDFYELYWAHMMEGTRFSQVMSWFKRLFVRGTDRVPPAVKGPWVAGWITLLVVLALLVILEALRVQVLRFQAGSYLIVFAIILISFGLAFLRHRVFVEVVGDAARYLTPSPPNIAARSRIRAAGLEVLRTLTEGDKYDRIILVTHSLGTVVGYDLLSLYWSEINTCIRHVGKSEALREVETCAQELLDKPNDDAALQAFRVAQRAYFEEVAKVAPGVWKITDFVTLGSPLTHAHFLLVDDKEKLLESEERMIAAGWLQRWWALLDAPTKRIAALFRARAAQRELPLCPPLTEEEDAFTYDPKTGDYIVPHHAALFAAVRWTNIYAPRRNLLWGDVIGGPVAPLFGPGVKDVAINGDAGRSFVAHVRYWDLGHGDHEHLEALRAAINLLDQPEEEAWARHAREVDSLRGAASREG